MRKIVSFLVFLSVILVGLVVPLSSDVSCYTYVGFQNGSGWNKTLYIGFTGNSVIANNIEIGMDVNINRSWVYDSKIWNVSISYLQLHRDNSAPFNHTRWQMTISDHIIDNRWPQESYSGYENSVTLRFFYENYWNIEFRYNYGNAVIVNIVSTGNTHWLLVDDCYIYQSVVYDLVGNENWTLGYSVSDHESEDVWSYELNLGDDNSTVASMNRTTFHNYHEPGGSGWLMDVELMSGYNETYYNLTLFSEIPDSPLIDYDVNGLFAWIGNMWILLLGLIVVGGVVVFSSFYQFRRGRYG